MAIFIGLVKTLVVLLTMGFVDKRWGRRPMLLVSGGGMATCMMALGLNLQLLNSPEVTIVLICLFMASFSLGYGPVGWVVVSEVFPLQVAPRLAQALSADPMHRLSPHYSSGPRHCSWVLHVLESTRVRGCRVDVLNPHGRVDACWRRIFIRVHVNLRVLVYICVCTRNQRPKPRGNRKHDA